ncbi:class I lanthipeptide [Chitinophaga nivalis]|uniref:Class I lanthipeptide n=1 Tax=Chitinophaga nivalis TaxID=2991709 RepID=A0ABT3IGV7_9BACT|nr:class I lanthipeptide [Chitinophaga nivalis]MCW3467128.1 class I lanthipeptide [Chitinophaga nivalis]MCW3483181.1 class I lanthipeptide [Chitinophaga nivalis]
MKKRNDRVINKRITLNKIAIVTLNKAEKNSIVGRRLLDPQVGPSSWPPCDVSNTKRCEETY